ncbi:hypothetical protein GO755_10520 [Spirosoma sp. HMF4905]|uniref:Helix-turn-helix domain-containing protein n=1 Tax=Spirosoma arboris TaxID=2682092 RepID=A0A7K1S9Y5_9BACT|nr:helix-turn-helix domain-containing protein [Spirosoma arboris]MVM30468.1 hypothetical protein [Spirosoma arboris]
MVQTPSWEEFEKLTKEIQTLRDELDFIKQIMIGYKWIDSKQLAEVLKVSQSTIWRYRKLNLFTVRAEGAKVFFEIESVRNYMESRKIPHSESNRRLLRVVLK